MDDLSSGGADLENALEDLRWVNRWLGGHAAVEHALAPLVKAHRGTAEARPLRLLDLGTGAADHPEHLIRWADRLGCPLEITALDANPHIVRYARRRLLRRLPAYLRARIHVEQGDAFAPPDEPFDAALAVLFLHHFDADRAAALLRVMKRVSSAGIVVCDLHRHVLAYHGVRALGAVRPGTSDMFKHDGPLSVRRGWRRNELHALAERAGLTGYRLRWHWAFRWVLSTIDE